MLTVQLLGVTSEKPNLRGFSINTQIQTSILFSKIAHSNVQKNAKSAQCIMQFLIKSAQWTVQFYQNFSQKTQTPLDSPISRKLK